MTRPSQNHFIYSSLVFPVFCSYFVFYIVYDQFLLFFNAEFDIDKREKKLFYFPEEQYPEQVTTTTTTTVDFTNPIELLGLTEFLTRTTPTIIPATSTILQLQKSGNFIPTNSRSQISTLTSKKKVILTTELPSSRSTCTTMSTSTVDLLDRSSIAKVSLNSIKNNLDRDRCIQLADLLRQAEKISKRKIYDKFKKK